MYLQKAAVRTQKIECRILSRGACAGRAERAPRPGVTNPGSGRGREQGRGRHTHTRTHALTHVHAHTLTHTRTHNRTHAHKHAHALTHLCTCAHARAHAHMHSRTHALTHSPAARNVSLPVPLLLQNDFLHCTGVTCPSLCRQAPGVGQPNGAPRLCDALGGWACAVSCPGPCPWARAAGWVPRGPVFWGEEGGPDLSASVCTGGKGQEPQLMVTSRIKQVMSKTQVNARVNSVNLPPGLASGPCSRARVEPSRPTPNWPRLSQP